MLWRLLWSLSRGVRLPGGGAAGLPHPRPVAPVQPHEAEPLLLGQESTQTDGSWHGRNQQHKACGYGNLSRYTPLEAFTWSALAGLALELAKQVRWLSSVQPCGRDAGIHQLEGQLAILSQHQHSDSPTAPSPCSSEEEEQHFFVGVESGHASKNPSSSITSQQKEYQFLSETGDFIFLPNTSLEPDSCLLHLQGNLEDEESVKEAASQVQQVFQASISMASNILGLEYMQDGQHTIAFSCFKLAADQNYSKSQFNVGLCYEHGRGTKKNMAKAAFYYQRAAHQGHTRAQYRCAKWLLHHRPRTDNDGNVQEAVAIAGLTQDSSSRFHWGVDYGKGFRVMQNPLTARMHYQQTAAANYKPAQERMAAMTQEEIAAMHRWNQLPLAVRTFSSSPCLQSLDQPLTSHVALGLLHSWSTGSLRDVTSSSVNCMPSPAFPDGLSLKLQSLAWSPGMAIS